MPLYDYQCRACGKVTEVRHGFKETFEGTCPSCSGEMKRVFSAAGIVFKGSGFYVTDSRKSSGGDSASSSSSSSSSKSDGASKGEHDQNRERDFDLEPSEGSGRLDAAQPEVRNRRLVAARRMDQTTVFWIAGAVAAFVFIDVLIAEIRRSIREARRIAQRIAGYADLPIVSLAASMRRTKRCASRTLARRSLPCWSAPAPPSLPSASPANPPRLRAAG